jgi:hypothetical protein
MGRMKPRYQEMRVSTNSILLFPLGTITHLSMMIYSSMISWFSLLLCSAGVSCPFCDGSLAGIARKIGF